MESPADANKTTPRHKTVSDVVGNVAIPKTPANRERDGEEWSYEEARREEALEPRGCSDGSSSIRKEG